MKVSTINFGASSNVSSSNTNLKKVDIPPKNQVFEKNGKKVPANIGTIGGSVFATLFTSALVAPTVAGIIDSRDQINITNAKKETLDAVIKNTDYSHVTKHYAEHLKQSRKCVMDGYDELLTRYKKDLKTGKRDAVIISVLGLLASAGAVALRNASLNKKRAKLAVEPEKVQNK